MASIEKGKSADKFVPGTVQHFIASECDACDLFPARTSRVVIVRQSASGNTVAHGTQTEVERIGIAKPGASESIVSVEWAGTEHAFDRKTGLCAETTRGMMREWILHPFEVTANKDITVANFGEGGVAPISRVPAKMAVDTLPRPSKPDVGQRWRSSATGRTLSIVSTENYGEEILLGSDGETMRVSRFDLFKGDAWSYVGSSNKH